METAGSPLIEINRWSVILTYMIVLAVHGLLNVFGVNLVKVFGDISVWVSGWLTYLICDFGVSEFAKSGA